MRHLRSAFCDRWAIVDGPRWRISSALLRHDLRLCFFARSSAVYTSLRRIEGERSRGRRFRGSDRGERRPACRLACVG